VAVCFCAIQDSGAGWGRRAVSRIRRSSSCPPRLRAPSAACGHCWQWKSPHLGRAAIIRARMTGSRLEGGSRALVARTRHPPSSRRNSLSAGLRDLVERRYRHAALLRRRMCQPGQSPPMLLLHWRCEGARRMVARFGRPRSTAAAERRRARGARGSGAGCASRAGDFAGADGTESAARGGLRGAWQGLAAAVQWAKRRGGGQRPPSCPRCCRAQSGCLVMAMPAAWSPFTWREPCGWRSGSSCFCSVLIRQRSSRCPTSAEGGWVL